MKNQFNAEKNRKGPDPFFTEFQRSSNSNPDKDYYKDLMKKIFMFTGAFIFLKMLLGVGSEVSGRGTVNPELERQYMQ